MQFGHNEFKFRVKPSFSGQRATCPLCNGILVGKCGEIYNWHWQHFQDRNCDPWKEHETYWHRKWKSMFPNEWQEVIIEKSLEKHIADVKTSGEVVIEFQNSSILTSTIRIREEFYGAMIWVVNAKSFKGNFSLRSIVSSRLRNIEVNTSAELSQIEKEYHEQLKKIEEELKESKIKIESKSYDLENKRRELCKLEQIGMDFDVYSNDFIKSCSSNENYLSWSINTFDFERRLRQQYKAKFKDIISSIDSLKAHVCSEEKRLEDISRLESVEIEGKIFKIVDYCQLKPESFYKTRAILRTSRNSFFPIVVSIKSKSEFLRYEFKKDLYELAVDPSETTNNINEKVDNDRNRISICEGILSDVKREIKDILFEEVTNKIETSKKKFGQVKQEYDELIKENERLTVCKLKGAAKMEEEMIAAKVVIDKRRNEQRFKIMKEKKGLYTFNWKHERTSWRAANSPIYFDIGKDYLFERVQDNLFKKVEITTFLNNHLRRNPAEVHRKA